MSLPGASVRKHQGRLEVSPWCFGVRDTKNLRPAIFQLKKKILAAYKGIRAASEVVVTEAQFLTGT